MKFTTLANGFRCYYQHWFPENPRALIVMVHGLGDHIGRYNELVSFLACRGFACALFDQRGHGLSEGRRGHVKSFDVWLEDLQYFFDFSRERMTPGVPVFLMGGSLGVLICLNFIVSSREKIAGLISASGAIRADVEIIPEWQKKIARFLSKFIPSFSVDNKLKWENMTRDPDEMASLTADRLFHRRITVGAAVEVEKRLNLVMGIPHRIQVPVLALVGSADPICRPMGTRRFVDRLSSIDKKFISYEGMLHDIIHDVGRKRVMEDIEKWLIAHTSDQKEPGTSW